MKDLITILKALVKAKPLSSFEWALKNPPIQIPRHIATSFDKNIYLKNNLHIVLRDDADLKHHFWVINTWGEIGSLKPTEKNKSILHNLRHQLSTGYLRKKDFAIVASISKIASFYEPAKYAIYDSRAVYSLNWLLYRYCGIRKLYPQPVGRGAAVELHMQTIYTLASGAYSTLDEYSAYHDYCKLLKELAGEIFGDRDKPYLVEMLLFKITDTFIREDILKTIQIKFS